MIKISIYLFGVEVVNVWDGNLVMENVVSKIKERISDRRMFFEQSWLPYFLSGALMILYNVSPVMWYLDYEIRYQSLNWDYYYFTFSKIKIYSKRSPRYFICLSGLFSCCCFWFRKRICRRFLTWVIIRRVPCTVTLWNLGPKYSNKDQYPFRREERQFISLSLRTTLPSFWWLYQIPTAPGSFGTCALLWLR